MENTCFKYFRLKLLQLCMMIKSPIYLRAGVDPDFFLRKFTAPTRASPWACCCRDVCVPPACHSVPILCPHDLWGIHTGLMELSSVRLASKQLVRNPAWPRLLAPRGGLYYSIYGHTCPCLYLTFPTPSSPGLNCSFLREVFPPHMEDR